VPTTRRMSFGEMDLMVIPEKPLYLFMLPCCSSFAVSPSAYSSPRAPPALPSVGKIGGDGGGGGSGGGGGGGNVDDGEARCGGV